MRSRLTVLALLAVFPLVACGGDGGVGLSGDSLTEEEAAALAQVVMSQGFSSAPEPSGGGDLVSARSVSFVPIPIDEQVSVENVPCPLGGAFSVSGSLNGTIDPELEAIDVTYTFEHEHSDCGVSPEDADVEFTLDGNPNITHTYDLTTGGDGSLALDGSIVGGVSWATDDGRNGTCPIDIGMSVSGFAVDSETGSVDVDVAGTVCGVDFSESLSVNSAT